MGQARTRPHPPRAGEGRRGSGGERSGGPLNPPILGDFNVGGTVESGGVRVAAHLSPSPSVSSELPSLPGEGRRRSGGEGLTPRRISRRWESTLREPLLRESALRLRCRWRWRRDARAIADGLLGFARECGEAAGPAEAHTLDCGSRAR